MDYIAILRDETERLVRAAQDCPDLEADSLCSGWTRAHVLTHVARNADALAGVLNEAAQNRAVAMYASKGSRERDIEQGAGRTKDAIVSDLARSSVELQAALAVFPRLDPDHLIERVPGEPGFTIGQLPAKRLREVTYHHVDLRTGFTFADLPAPLVSEYLAGEIVAGGGDAAVLLLLARQDGSEMANPSAWATAT